MDITPDQINLWLNITTENQNLEFKEAKTQYDTEKLYKYCVAIANEGGGFLVMGVTDKSRAKLSEHQPLKTSLTWQRSYLQLLVSASI